MCVGGGIKHIEAASKDSKQELHHTARTSEEKYKLN